MSNSNLSFIIEEAKSCIKPKGAFNFKGRATRGQFLVALGVSISLAILVDILNPYIESLANLIGVEGKIISIALIIYPMIISFSATLRRVHDYCGNIYLCFLVLCIPGVGFLIYLYLMLNSKTYRGPTIYGPDPYGGDRGYQEWLQFMKEYENLKRQQEIAASADPDYNYYTAEEKELASRMSAVRTRAARRRQEDEDYLRRKREEEAREAEEERMRQETARRMNDQFNNY